MAIKLRKQDQDLRVVDIDGRRFEVHTCRNTRGNISGYGIFERWAEPRPTGTPGVSDHGAWHIDPAQASLKECRGWLESFARGERVATICDALGHNPILGWCPDCRQQVAKEENKDE